MKRLLSLFLLLSILLSLLTACSTTPGDTSSGGSDAEAVQIPQRFFPTKSTKLTIVKLNFLLLWVQSNKVFSEVSPVRSEP